MNYAETLSYLFERLPMYQRTGKAAYKADLTRIKALCSHLGNPEQKLKCIHIAGTNGKGSTSHMLASILQKAGYKVGLYTSPHLVDFRERVRINGKPIEKEAVIDFVENNKDAFEPIGASFFEWSVALAFHHFEKQQTDINIIEVGLGGRLDATNVITPILSVITNIGLDHQAFLGNTRVAIAGEKAGIIKEEVPVILGEIDDETFPVFEKIAKDRNAELIEAEKKETTPESDLKGAYQKQNIQTVLTTAMVLKNLGYSITENELNEGLLHVVESTGLKGRWQIVKQNPTIVLDVAHNKEGLSYVFDQLQSLPQNKLHIVWGMVNDKDFQSIVPIMPEGEYYACSPNIPRALAIEDLENILKPITTYLTTFSSVAEAIKAAMANAEKEDVIYIGGSTFVVAEALTLFE